MNSRSRKALSWSVSIVVHTVLIFFIGRAALNYALPEGEVNTDPTTIDVVGNTGDFKTVEPKENAAPSAPAAKSAKAKAEPKVHVFKGTQDAAPNDDHVTFLPDKDFNQIKAAPPEEDVQDVSKDEPAKEVVPEAIPQNAVNEDEGVEKSENVPQTLPKKEQVAQAEPTAAPAEVAPATGPVEESQGTPAAPVGQPDSGSGDGKNGDAPPAYGTPGTSLDITKLMEKSGNPKPYYPFAARFRHQEGLVILRAFIEKDGKVNLPSIEKSSGFPTLDAEALKAFTRWRYEPNQGGWALKPFQFNIKK